MRTAIALAVALLVACTSHEDLADFVKECAPCAPGDSCVLAGGSQCSCPAAVNAKHAAEVDELANEIFCGGVQVSCAVGVPKCVDGTCVMEGG